MADNMRTDLVCDAIDMAVRRCPHQKNVTIFHSDRGSQYTSQQFARHLEHHKIRPSVGRTGVCWDNAWAESFNATLKNERVHRMVRPTREKAINFCCLVDRTDLQSHATPLNARLPHPQRGRTRAEKPQTRSLRPPKTTVRETPSTPITADRRQRVRGKGDDHPAQEAPPTANSTRRRRRRTGASTGSAGPKERTIAHIKSWRILHTPYRRPLETFEQTITAALALYSFKTTP